MQETNKPCQESGCKNGKCGKTQNPIMKNNRTQKPIMFYKGQRVYKKKAIKLNTNGITYKMRPTLFTRKRVGLPFM